MRSLTILAAVVAVMSSATPAAAIVFNSFLVPEVYASVTLEGESDTDDRFEPTDIGKSDLLAMATRAAPNGAGSVTASTRQTVDVTDPSAISGSFSETIDPGTLPEHFYFPDGTTYAYATYYFSIDATADFYTHYTFSTSGSAENFVGSYFTLSNNDTGHVIDGFAVEGAEEGTMTTSIGPGSYALLFGDVNVNHFFSGSANPLTIQGTFDFAIASRVAGVPEPATWALAICGVGLIGAALRRRPRELRLTLV